MKDNSSNKTSIIVAVVCLACLVGLIAWGVNRGNSNNPSESQITEESPVETPPSGIITESQQKTEVPDLGDLDSDYFGLVIHGWPDGYTQKTTSEFESQVGTYRYYVVDEMTTSSADSSLDGKKDVLTDAKEGTVNLENGVNVTYVTGMNKDNTSYEYEFFARRLIGESDGLSTYLFMVGYSHEEFNVDEFCSLLSDTHVEIQEY